MPDYYIEMLWGCSACNASNRGRDMSCSKCGRPKDDKSPEWMPGDTSPMAAVVEPEHIRMASAGENWKCQFCGVSVRAFELTCTECGAKKDKIKADLIKRHGELVEQKFGPKQEALDELEKVRKRLDELDRWERQQDAPSWIRDALDSADEEDSDDESPAPREPELNAGYRSAGFRPEPEPEPAQTFEQAAVPYRLPGWFSWRKATIVGACVLGVGLLVLLLWWLFHTSIVDAKVVGKSWQRSIAVERYEIHGHDGWSPDADAFDVRDEGQRVHHYDHVRVGSHQESYSVSEVCGQDCSTTPRRCRSNKNGFASCSGGDRVCTNRYCNRTKYKTVDDYENQPRYRTWYSWKRWEWGHNRTVRSAGNVDVPYWPTLEQLQLCDHCGPGENERMGAREEAYSLRLERVDTHDIMTPDVPEGTFLSVKIGDKRKVRVGIVYGVKVLP